MKNLFTYLLVTLFGLSTAFAQVDTDKASGEKASIEDRLEMLGMVNPDRDRSSGQAKQLEGMLTANGGYGVAGGTVDIPFSLLLTNEDLEYADFISITFPEGFTINSVSNNDVFGPSFDDDPDSEDGDPEPFNGIDGQTVSWGDDDNSWGGITAGAEYTFTINVTVGDGVTGEQTVDYSLSGDGFGPSPGDLEGSLTLTDFTIGLPLDFELPAEAYEFLGFEGADSAIEENPDQSAPNESETIMRSIKTDGSAVFAGTFVDLDEPINFDATTTLLIDTWVPTSGITVRVAVENQDTPSQVAVDVETTVDGGWETLEVDFSAIDPGTDYNRVVVIFDFDVVGDGTTYYFDNIRLQPTIFDIVEGSDVHNTLETAVIAAGIDGLLDDPTFEGTLFAPTDAAFDALPDGVLDALLDDATGALLNVLLHHAVVGTALSTDLSDGLEILTAQGETVTVTITGEDVFINSGDVTAQVVIADLIASNGVVHVIDAVLVPEFCTIVNNTWATFLNDEGAGAPVADGGICPINYSPFASWASEAYQVDNFVAGTTYTFGLAGADEAVWDPSFLVQNATTGEIIATQDEGFSITFEVPEDGTYLLIIHEQGLCGTQSDNLETDNGIPYLTCESSQTVVDIIVNSPDHTTLEAAVLAAGLDGALSGEGPFTVFAPTDDAFDALPEGLLDDLLADPNGLLTDVLQHHVHGGLAFSASLSDGQLVPTLNGEDVTIGVDEGTVTVTSALEGGAVATVTVADIVASNGVVHVIDAVLTPSILSVDELSTVTEFRMFPNPANNEVSVELQMSQSDDLTIDVVNILGQNVKSFDFGTRSAGFNRELLDVNDLPEGMYILNITVGEDQATTKLQITR